MKLKDKEKIKEILGLPEEAKPLCILFRPVSRRSKKHYPALLYRIKGQEKIKHIRKDLWEQVLKSGCLDNTLDNGLDNSLESLDNKLDNKLSKQEGNLSKQLSKHKESYLNNLSKHFLNISSLTFSDLLSKLSEEQRKEVLKELLEGIALFYQNSKIHPEEIEFISMLCEFLTDILKSFNKSESGSIREL